MKSPFLKLLAAGLPIIMLVIFFVEGIPNTFTSGADYAITLGYIVAFACIAYWLWIWFETTKPRI